MHSAFRVLRTAFANLREKVHTHTCLSTAQYHILISETNGRDKVHFYIPFNPSALEGT